jgi:Asp-tRNA(Asn)/Glu-tRNA(Gln) amidotransferase A subunit family amidase
MLSALDLARRIEAGDLTPRAVVELCAEAIAAREGEIGAFATLDLDRARRAADEFAARFTAMPLRGLPVGVKDIFDTADLPTEYNSPIYAGHRPRADAPAVAMTRRAGGIVIGKTVTTEFASVQPAATRNPHNPAHTPGGSSSGSAAGLAAGMFPIALGSQTGGSIIRPAAYCGVAGFKPSYKLIPTVGMTCVSWYLDTAGLFAARVADVAFAAAAITGRDLRVDAAEAGSPRIALVRTHLWHEADAAMQQAIATAARAAEAAGVRVVTLDLPAIFADAYAAHGTIADYEAFRALAWEYDNHRDRLGPIVRARIERGAAVSADDYDLARRTARGARRTLADLMTEIGADAILTPSAPGAAPLGLGSIGEGTFNRLWTLMGTPSVNVPGLADAAGLPLGLQIVGRFGRDRAALAAAHALERALVHSERVALSPAQ